MTNQPASSASDDFSYEHRPRRAGAPWAGGLILIVVGGFLLLQNLNINLPFLHNWWALFILIPAIGAYSNAWNEWRATGVLNVHARGSLIGAFFLTALSLALLFGLTSSLFWPVMLILGGLSLLGNTLIKN
jgi:hypothetical protein